MAVLAKGCHSMRRHLTLTAGRNAHVVQVNAVISTSYQATHRVHVRPLLHAARVADQSVFQEATTSLGFQRVSVVAARRLVELLRDVVTLEQFQNEALFADGERSSVALRRRQAAIQLVGVGEYLVSS